MGDNVEADGVAVQSFSVQEIVRSSPQVQVLHPSAAVNDSPWGIFLSLASQYFPVSPPFSSVDEGVGLGVSMVIRVGLAEVDITV